MLASLCEAALKLRHGSGRLTTSRFPHATLCSVFSLVLDLLHDTPQLHQTYNCIAMAPSDKVLSNVIQTAVRRMFKGPDRDSMTVNNIREQVEAELHLEAGFLKQGSWKQESKNIVNTEHVTGPVFCCHVFQVEILNPVVGKASVA